MIDPSRNVVNFPLGRLDFPFSVGQHSEAWEAHPDKRSAMQLLSDFLAAVAGDLFKSTADLISFDSGPQQSVPGEIAASYTASGSSGSSIVKSSEQACRSNLHALRTAETLYAWHTSRCNRLSREIQELHGQGADRSGLQTDKAKALAALLDDKRARFTAEHKSLLRAKHALDEVKNRQLLLRHTSIAVFSRSQSAEHSTYRKAPAASSVSSGSSIAPGSRRHTSSSPTRHPRRAGTGTNQGRTMRARSQE